MVPHLPSASATSMPVEGMYELASRITYVRREASVLGIALDGLAAVGPLPLSHRRHLTCLCTKECVSDAFSYPALHDHAESLGMRSPWPRRTGGPSLALRPLLWVLRRWRRSGSRESSGRWLARPSQAQPWPPRARTRSSPGGPPSRDPRGRPGRGAGGCMPAVVFSFES